MFRLWKEGIVEKRDILLKAHSLDELTNKIAQAERGMFEDEEEAREPDGAGGTRCNHGNPADRSDSGGPGLPHAKSSWRCCWRSSSSGPARCSARSPSSMGLITDDQLAQGLAEQMGMQVVSLSDVVIPPEVLTHITEPMAQLYRIVPLQLRGQRADDRHVRSAEAVDHRRVAEFPGLRHQGDGRHREGDAQGAGAVLFGRRRERGDADRRHGAGRRVGGGGAGDGEGRARWI